MATKKKWASSVNVRQGRLTRFGWPSLSKLKASIRAGRVSYATVIRMLAFIANAGKNARARRFMVALKAWRARTKGK